MTCERAGRARPKSLCCSNQLNIQMFKFAVAFLHSADVVLIVSEAHPVTSSKLCCLPSSGDMRAEAVAPGHCLQESFMQLRDLKNKGGKRWHQLKEQ